MHRIHPRSALFSAALLLAAAASAATAADDEGQQAAAALPFLIGGYGGGLYAAEFDPKSGKIVSEPIKRISLERASFFVQHPVRVDRWYSVSELDREGFSLVAIAADPQLRELKLLNSQSTVGKGPCYVSTDAKGQFAFAANYGDGSLTMFPIAEDGSLKPASDHIKHEGSGPNPKRQKEPHAHCVMVDPSDRWLLCTDLGIDRVIVYRIDRSAKKLEEHSRIEMPPGSGPRHMAFHPTLPMLYVINEMGSTIAVADWSAENGTGEVKEVVPTLPEEMEKNTTAEILVHPSGKFVFGSNRGHDSIVSYRVDPNDGTLELVGWCPSGGNTPRNFRIDPTGQYILAQNQDSDNVVVLKIDTEGGNLTPTGEIAPAPKPACIKFVR